MTLMLTAITTTYLWVALPPTTTCLEYLYKAATGYTEPHINAFSSIYLVKSDRSAVNDVQGDDSFRVLKMNCIIGFGNLE